MGDRRFPPSKRRLKEARKSGDLPRAQALTRLGSWVGFWLGVFCFIDEAWTVLFRQSQAMFSLKIPTMSEWGSFVFSLFLCFLFGGFAAWFLGSLAGGFLFSRPGISQVFTLSRLRTKDGFIGISAIFILVIPVTILVGLLLFPTLLFSSQSSLAILWEQTRSSFVLFLMYLSLLGLVFAICQVVLKQFLYSRRHRRSLEEFLRDLKEEQADKNAQNRLIRTLQNTSRPKRSPGGN